MKWVKQKGELETFSLHACVVACVRSAILLESLSNNNGDRKGLAAG